VLEVTTGAPISNFPVEIGSETVFTDDGGEFTLRTFSGRELAARPDTKTPHVGFLYELREGPEKVRPTKTGPAEEYLWKVRKVRAAPATGKSGLVVTKGAADSPATPAATPTTAH
jgi:hypothetical protein